MKANETELCPFWWSPDRPTSSSCQQLLSSDRRLLLSSWRPTWTTCCSASPRQRQSPRCRTKEIPSCLVPLSGSGAWLPSFYRNPDYRLRYFYYFLSDLKWDITQRYRLVHLGLPLVRIVVLCVNKPSEVLTASWKDRVEPLSTIVIFIFAWRSPQYLGARQQLLCILWKRWRTFCSVALMVGVECEPFIIALITLRCLSVDQFN